MRDSDYYPAGAYNDPNAPYNQPSDPDPIEVECDTVVTLRKTIIVETDNYTPDYDDDGSFDIELFDNCIDLANKVEEQHYSLDDLLNELVKYLKNDLCVQSIPEKRKRELREMLADAEGWEVDSVEVDDYET